MFTEIFETLKCLARQTMNIMVFQHIDDWLLLARDRDALGVATLCLVYLGVDWNFATCQV